ncbi:50S ribosomal protein L25/general stress protein Ctc [Martelella endophytica]|uniref:Large ribosomal subunit protein bL25 n=1 Tax=Martelella endophytica TaxID=1486262 RepID=A0A0D5LPY9_MAREN|nr:50S ribosomal protein L25/general stress protein Ctc [Martelella endophytica]AJY45995.1 50S ribosomal protein L25 [Martelella endophytica]
MSKNQSTLTAEARERVGKGSARELRRTGKIPAVIYGNKEAPVSIAIDRNEITKRIFGGGFMTTTFTVEVGKDKYMVLPKDYQLDPVRDFVMHVDFLRISEKSTVTVAIPVHFANEDKCPGIKRGGVLNIVRHEVEFHCPANAIPESITVDLISANLGDSLHISAVKLPENVTPVITDRDFTIATIAAPAGLKSDAEETEETVEEAEGETEE